MLVAIDGACKRNGEPDCISSGVAWIETEEGNLLYESRVEAASTNQRGEINGLMLALEYAMKHAKPDEDIIIITDSEYLHNTVALGWYDKWANNDWVGANGTVVKNVDMWRKVHGLLHSLNRVYDRVFMQWTKGHLMHYTPGNINRAMREDTTGIELYTRVSAMATRPADRDRIIREFLKERKEHDKPETPPEVALEWVVANTVADCIASYIVRIADELTAKA